MQDITFHSNSLNRDMPYRAILPANLVRGKRLPVVYLLHGRDGNFRDWSNDSEVAHFAEEGLLLVMPEGYDSYYTNSVGQPQDRYEDYIAKDLIADVEARFPAATGRSKRAILGVSMGGFGAVKIALKYPELFAFAGGISAAVDVPNRPFSWKRFRQSWYMRSIFGASKSQTRRDNNPFVLARKADPASAPYLFLACGEQESLLQPNREFATLLSQRNLPHEFHTAPAEHNWNQWNAWLPSCFKSLMQHIDHAS
jgi:putative tributyrin esterase